MKKIIFHIIHRIKLIQKNHDDNNEKSNFHQ